MNYLSLASVLLAFIVFGCTKVDQSQPAISTAKPAGAEGWKEQTRTDEIRGGVTRFASIESRPNDAAGIRPQVARLGLVKWDDVSPYGVLIELRPAAPMACTVPTRRGLHAKIAFKFDNSPPVEVLALCSEGLVLLTLDNDDAFTFIKFAGRKPKELLLELPFYPGQKEIYRFSVPPLSGEWESYSKSIDIGRPS